MNLWVLLLSAIALLRPAADALLPATKISTRTEPQLLGIEPLGAKARESRGYSGDEEGDERIREPDSRTDRPKQTSLERDPPEVSPSSPKIVVLGATGKLGRKVVRHLVEMDMDMTVVAFVRDYDKAIRVLYDDMLFARATKKKGPKLEIVLGNLVPPEVLPGFNVEDTEDEEIWLQTAQSASKYFGNAVEDHDNRELLPGADEALEEALAGCTAVISCVSSFRLTDIWSDVLPLWRLFRPLDVGRWCRDRRHPFYVHYLSTKKVLGIVEREQRCREAAALALKEEHPDSEKVQAMTVPRIRFIRISDLSVAQRPWHFVPLVTNLVQSIVLRYQEMSENLLESSSLIETIVLRPGDMVEDERVSVGRSMLAIQ